MCLFAILVLFLSYKVTVYYLQTYDIDWQIKNINDLRTDRAKVHTILAQIIIHRVCIARNELI